MQASQYLTQTNREAIPVWLENFKQGQKIEISDFFNSRTLFYPGSGHDGQPVELFGSSHAIHCFIYVDYGVSEAEIGDDLHSRNHSFRGYQTISRVKIQERNLTPKGWTPHVIPGEIRIPKFAHGFIAPFAFIEVLERVDGFDDLHGPKRIAILFLGADGIATYDALFCQSTYKPPFALVIQDHGWGGNYDHFSKGGLLERLAIQGKALPKFLLVAQNSEPWDGYVKIQDIDPTYRDRHLYRKENR